MAKKPFFKRRTEAQIRSLNSSDAYTQRNLVQRIDGLGNDEALLIRTSIIPARFRRGCDWSEASRKCRKHGSLIHLGFPSTLQDTLQLRGIPMDYRVRKFGGIHNRLHNGDLEQGDINFVGYCWRPVQTRDKLKRVVIFDTLPRGAKRFTYDENFTKYRQNEQDKKGVRVDAYPDAKRVRKEGARTVVEVCAEEEGRANYKFGLMHVPWLPNNPSERVNYNLATVLGLKPIVIREEESDEPDTGRLPYDDYDVRYTFEDSREGSGVLTYSVLDVQAYLGILKKQLVEEHNQTALTFNPFALPSQHQAIFHTKLDNNVLIYDPTVGERGRLRHLHLAEKSILLGRAIAYFGHDDFGFWNSTRDGIYKNYDW